MEQWKETGCGKTVKAKNMWGNGKRIELMVKESTQHKKVITKVLK